jgi:hypothetical protein
MATITPKGFFACRINPDLIVAKRKPLPAGMQTAVELTLMKNLPLV